MVSAKITCLTVTLTAYNPFETTFSGRVWSSNPMLDGRLLPHSASFFAIHILFKDLQLAPMAFLNFMVTSDSLRSVLLSVWISMA
jgi:hypothetical protein